MSDREYQISQESTSDDPFSRLGAWVKEAKENGIKFPTLKLPEELAPLFIPLKAIESAGEPDHIEIKNYKFEGTPLFERLRIIVVEKDSQNGVSNPDSWKRWIEERRRVMSSKQTRKYVPRPEDVDRVHASFISEIEKGELSLTDKILFAVLLHVHKELPQTINISYFDGATGAGIATEFYQKTLPTIARLLGYRFLAGANTAKNVSFFTKNIGRFTLNQIKPDKLSSLVLYGDPNDEISTVQFLYEEDKKEYVKEEYL